MLSTARVHFVNGDILDLPTSVDPEDVAAELVRVEGRAWVVADEVVINAAMVTYIEPVRGTD